MDEYVKRGSALMELCRGCSLKSADPSFFCGDPCPKYERLRSIPAEDVATIRRGHWKYIKPYNNTYMGFECSECGARFQGISTDNYCGHCGALMGRKGETADG